MQAMEAVKSYGTDWHQIIFLRIDNYHQRNKTFEPPHLFLTANSTAMHRVSFMND
jgi:hypothetical protein